MDINKWLGIVNGIPKDKLRTDEGLHQVFREIGKKAGKNFSDKEIQSFVSQFRKMQKTENVGSLMNKLSKNGLQDKDLNNIKKKFKK